MVMTFELQRFIGELCNVVLQAGEYKVETGLYLPRGWWQADTQQVGAPYAGLSVSVMNDYLAEFREEAKMALDSGFPDDLPYLQSRLRLTATTPFFKLSVTPGVGFLRVGVAYDALNPQLIFSHKIPLRANTPLKWRKSGGALSEYTGRRLGPYLERFLTYLYATPELSEDGFEAYKQPAAQVRFITRPWIAGLERLYAEYQGSKWQETAVYLLPGNWDPVREEITANFAGSTAAEYNTYLQELRIEAQESEEVFYRQVLTKCIPGTRRLVAVVFQYQAREITRKTGCVQYFVQPRYYDHHSEVVTGNTGLNQQTGVVWDADNHQFTGDNPAVSDYNKCLRDWFEALLAYGRHHAQVKGTIWRQLDVVGRLREQAVQAVLKASGKLATPTRFYFELQPAPGALYELTVCARHPFKRWRTAMYLPRAAWSEKEGRLVQDAGGVDKTVWNTTLDLLETRLRELPDVSNHLGVAGVIKDTRLIGLRRPINLSLRPVIMFDQLQYYELRGTLVGMAKHLAIRLERSWFGQLTLVGSRFEGGEAAVEANQLVHVHAEDLLRLAWHGKTYSKEALSVKAFPTSLLHATQRSDYAQLFREWGKFYVIVGEQTSYGLEKAKDAKNLAQELREKTGKPQLVCRVEEVIE